MRSPTAQFTASACNFVNWGCGNAGSPAIQLDAGRAIVQGCTFGEERLCVRVGSNVVSAILTANQALGGFIADNQAGGRAQIALNETDAITVWTPEMSSHYCIRVGLGDRRYLRNWHGREGGKEQQWRWSTADSQLVLPVSPNEPYTLVLEAEVPPPAVSEEAGIYLEGKRLAPLKAGGGMITLEIPATPEKLISLELRVNGWVPQKINAGSQDPRTLGIQLRALTMKAAKAGPNVFDVIDGI
jgi:hypothetical protein